MVADDVVPRDSNERHELRLCLEEIQIVEHDVAQRDAEGRVGSDQFFDDIVSDEVQFLLISRLRIAKHQGFERFWFLLRI